MDGFYSIQCTEDTRTVVIKPDPDADLPTNETTENSVETCDPPQPIPLQIVANKILQVYSKDSLSLRAAESYQMQVEANDLENSYGARSPKIPKTGMC